jgi:AcrR family transcriptional regulator
MPSGNHKRQAQRGTPRGRIAGRDRGHVPKPSTGSAGAPGRAPRKRSRAAKAEPGARRQAILDAALHTFAEHGFEAARLDDVAARAGVAKGTLYLYFPSKEALFEGLVRTAVAPIIARMRELAAAPDIPPMQAIEAFFSLFETEVLGTQRKLLLRLIISEGPRFPAIAEVYYREVVSRGLVLLRSLAERAARKGEFATDAPARFPQLVVAPLLVALIWDGLFARIDPLDVSRLLAAHAELLAGKRRKVTS